MLGIVSREVDLVLCPNLTLLLRRLMRFVSGRDSRLIAQARIKEARKALFGHEQGLPGERWLARPLVSRDMLQWYFPSKYGLQEFRLSEYYQMQAERFRKRPEMAWVSQFRETVQRIQENREEVDKLLTGEMSGRVDQVALQDLKEMVTLIDSMNAGETKEANFLRMVLMRDAEPSTNSDTVSETSQVPFEDKRHRFVDPLFRRRRLKWMERFLAGMNNKKEIRLNHHFTRHPDEQKKWPTNLGSVTVKWPNRRN
jgi:hypothetical protein